MARYQYSPFVEPLVTPAPPAIPGVPEWDNARPERAPARARATALLLAASVLVIPPELFAAKATGGVISGDQIPRTQVFQYQSTAGPVLIPAAAEPDFGWIGRYPDYIYRVAMPSSYSVGPLHVPDVTNPVPDRSWDPIYPSRVPGPRRTIEFPHFSQNIEPIPPATGVPDQWTPIYPDRISPAERSSEFRSPVGPLYVPDVTNPSPLLAWDPKYPHRLVRAGRTADFLFSSRPVEPPGAPAAPQFAAGGSGPMLGSIPIFQYQSLAGIVLIVPPPPAPELSWSPIYPNRLYPKAGLDAARQQFWALDRFDAPAAPTAPQVLKAVYPDIIPRRYPHATYAWVPQHFPTIVDLPVMSWTGWYPDNPVTRKRITASLLIIPPEFLPPAHSWKGWIPERIEPKRGLPVYKQQFWALDRFDAPPSEPAPLLSWGGIFPPGPFRRGQVAFYEFFWIDPRFIPPAAVVVPELSWKAIYPDRHQYPELPEFPAFSHPVFIPDVTQAVTPLSWDPDYPERVRKLVRLLAAQQQTLAWNTDTPVFIPPSEVTRIFVVPVHGYVRTIIKTVNNVRKIIVGG